MNFGKNAYGKIQGSYSDFGKFLGIDGINLQRRQLGVGVGLRF